MNEPFIQWQRDNDTFLASALGWLRLRLACLAPGEEPDPEEIAQAAADMAAAAATEPPPALHILGYQLGLTQFEQQVLLLCVSVELDTRIAGLCALAQDNLARPYPTFALALALFDTPAWDVLSPERPLRYWRLLEINQGDGQPLTTSPIRADERITNYVKGLNYLDERLLPFLLPFTESSSTVELPASQQTAATEISRQLGQARLPTVVQLVGPDPLSQQLVAQGAAAQLGRTLYRLPLSAMPTQTAELETLVRLWQRESLLLPLLLFLDARGVRETETADTGLEMLSRFLARSQATCLLATRDVQPGLGLATVSVDVDKPTPPEQEALWSALLPEAGSRPEPVRLAGQFSLNAGTIRQIADSAQAHARENGRDLSDAVWQACLLRARPRLDMLAQRIDAKATWEDIVLPPRELGQLRQIGDQVAQRAVVYDAWGFRQKMNRGLGISVLFAGESGTGKTMAAEVLANHLRLNLYRIDLSAVVSKYIGETEKNLRRLFDAAEDGGSILFFDEADALFGKRSEVKDSHDRYANIEINYLLQRMEAYRGLAILATNMKSALDRAFMRRLRFIVNFPFPGQEERRIMWQHAFPPQTPVNGLDVGRLARLNVTGGSIHNIAVNAAFLAAQADTAVTMPLIMTAARTEFYKLERPISETDFRL